MSNLDTIEPGTLLWQPTAEQIENSNLSAYMRWLKENYDLHFDNYDDLWQWSVDELPTFWQTIWDYFHIHAATPPDEILGRESMPGAEWFKGTKLNYAENFFMRMTAERPPILYQAEGEPLEKISKDELQRQTAALAHALREMGVQKGDRVVAYLPHIPQTIAAVMAVASIGAIWSSCSPDFGTRSVLDRFQQIEPKVLLAVDGYQYGGKTFDRRDVVAELQAGLPTVEHTILIPLITEDADLSDMQNTVLWDEALPADPPSLTYTHVPFDHPLWVLYSSGTTGLPKPIVQGHGGILLEHIKMVVLHLDLKPDDNFFWYTSTGWMMWNFLVGGLLAGCGIVIYNGSPGYPDMNALWKLAEEARITYFGTSAAFISACIKAEIQPGETFDLSHIRAVGSTGSPLTAEGFAWIYNHVNDDLALESVSGGTDLCTAFVGGNRLKPIYAGEIQGAALGAKVQAYDPAGEPMVDEMGELVITRPMPSMPLYFWGDENDERYTGSYFEMYPGVWRHGDWISFNERGGCIIYGRSDSTINRQGIRMGTSEIYRVVESFDEVLDSLVIDLELLGRESYLPLFLVLREGEELTADLRDRIKKGLRAEVSPRHVPDDMFVIDEVPYTLSGKKMEVPIRRILLGQSVEKVANKGAMRNPEAIDYFEKLAGKLNTAE